MSRFNVAARVVALIDAPDEATARRTFIAQLSSIDFDVLGGPKTVDAFESDDQS